MGRYNLSLLILLGAFCCGALLFFGRGVNVREGTSRGDAEQQGERGGMTPSDDFAERTTESTSEDEPVSFEVESIADILEGVDLSDPEQRQQAVSKVKELEDRRRRAGEAAARARGLPNRTEYPDGRVQEVVGVDHRGRPLYRTTHNANAAISSGANILNASPYFLNGTTDLRAGVWDGGRGRVSHQEFGGRVVARDGVGSIDHATHVIGTMAAAGVVPSARGVAGSMRIDSYDWVNDMSEMMGVAATTSTSALGGADSLLVSNHSYGYISGWNYVAGGSPFRLWEWWGDSGGIEAVESNFGVYNVYARDADSLAYGAPYYLMVRSGGNDRSNNPSSGQSVSLTPGGEEVVSYNPSIHPAGDGVYRGGFDTMGFDALAKNVLTVGAVADAVTGGVRDASRGLITTFSSFGPTDDGRIKPDLVANGETLYSTLSSGDSSYGTSSGTSMAAPGVAGVAMLLAQDYISRYGEAMRASTLKGLLIHTADDLGEPGPDYKYGWGLLNAQRAVDMIRDGHSSPAKKRITEGTMTRFGSAQNHSFTWDGGSPLRVTLSWTDPAGLATTTNDLRSARLRHNLNLRLISPSGVSYFPYVMPFVGTWTQASMDMPATTGINNTDNVEQVYLSTPIENGIWTVEVVRGGSFTSNQDYSLLITGSVGEQQAEVELSELFHIFDGTTKSPIITTSPPGLAVNITYNGSGVAPIDAGTYQIAAVVTEPGYAGSAEGTMEVAKADQVIFIPGVDAKTFGDPSFPLGATTTSGLSLSYSSSNQGVATVNSSGIVTINGAGFAELFATQAGGPNYNPASAGTLLFVNKAVGLLDFDSTEAIYDGTPKAIDVSSNPSGLGLFVLYNGDASPPSLPGTYSVYAEISDPNYQGWGATDFTILDAVGGVTYQQWLVNNFGAEAEGLSEDDDPDKDGVPNIAEFYLGTDPLDPDSRLKLDLQTGELGGRIWIAPIAERGSYILEFRDELGQESTDSPLVFTAEELQNGEAYRDLSKSGLRGFYRMRYEPPVE